MPISIVLICIGEEESRFLKELDSDEGQLLGSKGKVARDIVQHIHLNHFTRENAILLPYAILD